MPPCLLDLPLCSPSLPAINIRKKDLLAWDFPGGPVVKTLSSPCRGQGSVPGEGTRSHMPQLKISCATTKTKHSQINTFFKKKKRTACLCPLPQTHPYASTPSILVFDFPGWLLPGCCPGVHVYPQPQPLFLPREVDDQWYSHISSTKSISFRITSK